jgi:hypothetical protein
MVDDLSFDSIDKVAASWLESDFEEREMWEVVKAMNGDKASGIDGLLYGVLLVVLKEDVMKIFCDFHASGKFKRGLNVTFLAPIPKIPRAVNPMDFHSINLVGSIYKIIAKTQANELKMLFKKIISKSQKCIHLRYANSRSYFYCQ